MADRTGDVAQGEGEIDHLVLVHLADHLLGVLAQRGHVKSCHGSSSLFQDGVAQGTLRPGARTSARKDINAYRPLPMITRTAIAPMTRDVLKLAVETMMIRPSPFSAAMNSPMIAPITASVMAIFIPLKM